MNKLPLRILVVDDNRSSANALAKLLSRNGDDVAALYDGASAIERIRVDPPDIVLTDLKMEPVDGMAVLSAARSSTPSVEVIVFTAFGAVDVAVRAMHLGARDFLTKPVTVDQVSARLESLRAERAGTPAPDSGDEAFVAHAEASKRLLQTLERAAGVPSAVWLGGELGSGRAYAARTLHRLGDPGNEHPFLVANPRAPIEWPASGTVVLPNVDALDADQQIALTNQLREAPPGVRVIATASDDGRQQVASGQLRPELFYQLAVVVIDVPPLRQRKEDIRPLFDAAISHYSQRYQRPRPEVPERVYRDLQLHYWPGNIRELRNVAERVVVLGSQGMDVGVIPDTSATNPGLPKLEPGFSLSRYLEDVERSILEEALRQTGGDRNAAGRLLGVERNTLRYKLNKYDLLERTNH